MEKPATNTYPILDVIRRRWSPYVFADRPVEREKLLSLFEAARWSASAFNEQPWRFIVATKEDRPAFQKMLGCLVEANQAWAQHAPVLILTVTRTRFTRNDHPNRVHQHDLGLAVQNLVLQAMSMDLFSHQMAGIDIDKIRKEYKIPEDYEPQTAIAIGYGVEPDALTKEQLDKAQSPRSRHPFDSFIFGTSWEQPSTILNHE